MLVSPSFIQLITSPLPKHDLTWHYLRSPPLSPPQKHRRRSHSPAKPHPVAPLPNHQPILNLRPRPRHPGLQPPPHDRGAQPGPPQQGVRSRRVSEAGPGQDPDGAGAHGLAAVDGVQEDEAAGGVREGDGRRRVQRDHMGRGGGPVVSGAGAGEGGDGEVDRGAGRERDL
ncbi:hypothetical protein C1H46_021263 [Malus baccata]|uniref:Uncharacterized protein n=1 Tax=Malus baccata TaxID=106549 RepID=A0A540M349_MALBA|nr:hypothetical protein C1H46_021263 [Malus baccata]